MEIVRHWALAAASSVIENIYGPTELTIACTAYRWDNTRSPEECEQGIVPIGQPFDGMQALIVDEQLREVEQGRDGELLMTGPQLSLGYWQDEEETRQAFVPVAGKNGTYSLHVAPQRPGPTPFPAKRERQIRPKSVATDS